MVLIFRKTPNTKTFGGTMFSQNRVLWRRMTANRQLSPRRPLSGHICMVQYPECNQFVPRDLITALIGDKT
jgi:hypothetical protein